MPRKSLPKPRPARRRRKPRSSTRLNPAIGETITVRLPGGTGWLGIIDRACAETGLSLAEIASAALAVKLREFDQTGRMSLGADDREMFPVELECDCASLLRPPTAFAAILK